MISLADVPPPGVSLSTAQIILAILSTLGVGSVLAAIVNGLWTRKKLGADATEIITKAASGVVENLNGDNKRLRDELDEERRERKAEVATFRREIESQRREFRRVIDLHTEALQEHAAWDALAIRRLEEAGIEGLPQPPALYSEEARPSMVKELLSDG